MARVSIFFCLVFTYFVEVHSEKDPEAVFRKLPKLFHLDDFEQCLERKDGVYCLGQFEIYNDVQPNPLYDLIQEKSQDPHLYNRSYLHRGYCLPTRCPGGEANASARFERCVDAWARAHSLRARLHTLHYCRAHGQPRPGEADTSDWLHHVVLYFACFMVSMVVVGTVYDLYFAKKGSKNPYLKSFSIRISWNHLTSTFQDVDPRLRELEIFNGIRFYLGIGLILCHVYILTSSVYQYNPRFMEKFLNAPNGFMLGASMVFTLTFIIMSNFLTAYNILVWSQKVNFSLKLFPVLVIKRIIRLYPVYILLNAFAATWWRNFGDGPLWPVLLAKEGAICRKKFWATAAFLQNFINRKELCLVQTWILAVDLQLHLFTLFLTLILLKHRQHAVKVLSVLFAAATVLVAQQAYAHDLIPSYLYMTPEIFRNAFIGADSFFDLYIHPINGLMAAIAGTMLAFIHLDHQERGIKMARSKILVCLHYLSLTVIVYAWWYLAYTHFRHFDRPTQNLMVAVERVVSAIQGCFVIYSFINYKSFGHYHFSWRPLRISARLALSVSMSHWCINILLLTNRWTPHDSSVTGIITDIIGVHILAHIVAIPLTLIVEYPLQKVLDRILNQNGLRWFNLAKGKSK